MDYFERIMSIKNELTEDRLYKNFTIFGRKFRFTTQKNDIRFIREQQLRLLAYIEQTKYFLEACCNIRDCKKATGEIRKIQEGRFEGLKFLLDIFNKNGISYWIDGGSLLGAYRHNGFIPWDDDIDIATDRENYEKMIEILTKTFKDTDFSIDFGRDETGFYMKFFFKTFGILDIFVYDYSNNTKSQEKLYEIWLKARTKFYRKYDLKKIVNKNNPLQNYIKPMYEFYKKYNLIIEGENKKKWLFKGFDAATKNLTRNIFLVDKIFPLQEVTFEDIKVLAPNDIRYYLENVNSGTYGNIDTFPPLSTAHIYSDNAYTTETFDLIDEMIKYIKNFK